MRIVCISDTHSLHERIKEIPDGDVLIHAGDLTNSGVPAEVFDAFTWLSRQPHARVIAIPGNHDFALERVPQLTRVLRSKFPRVELLNDDETMLDGMRVWGSPWQPWFHEWAFNFRPGPPGEREAEDKWEEIPDDVAVLITHGPAYGVLDELRGEHVG